jgi:hypothetical protein
MHLAERFSDVGLGRGRMGERGPVGAGYFATPYRLAPKGPELLFGLRPGELIDRQAVTFIQRLVEQLGWLIVVSGKTDCSSVEIMVRAFGSHDADFLQNAPQVRRGKTRPDNRTVQVGVEFPEPGAALRTLQR